MGSRKLKKKEFRGQHRSSFLFSRKLEETTKSLKKMANELEIEKQKTDELLCELMPASIADALRQGKMVEASESIH